MTHLENLNNGEAISQARNADLRLCPVLAALRIRNRSRHINDNENCPLTTHETSKKSSLFITNRNITDHLKATVTAAHSVTSRAELKLWSTHSIRVGERVLLREGDHYTPFIKTRLRWKSDTCRGYLRDTSFLASQHSATVQQHFLSYNCSLGYCTPFFLHTSLSWPF